MENLEYSPVEHAGESDIHLVIDEHAVEPERETPEFQRTDEQQAAFNQIVSEHRDRLTGYAKGFTGSWHDAEEIVQTAFMRTWTSESFDPINDDPKGWLYTVVRNLATDRYKSTANQPDLVPIHPDDNGEISFKPNYLLRPNSDPAHAAIQRERVMAAADALAKLDPKGRSALLQSTFGVPVREIADNIGLSVGATKATIERARLDAKLSFDQRTVA